MVRVTRDGGIHEIKDVTVTIALAGDFGASHIEGDNTNVVPTDTQKNTVFAFAKEAPVGEIEEFGLRLARHFAGDFASVHRARVSIEEHPWTRIDVAGRPHPHAFMRGEAEKRLATVTCTNDGAWVVAGLSDLILLKSTGSEFRGYPKDRYTTLEETRDRVLALAVWAARRRLGRSFRDGALGLDRGVRLQAQPRPTANPVRDGLRSARVPTRHRRDPTVVAE